MSDNNCEIKTHDFQNAKNALKQFSKKLPSSPNLPTVATDAGIFDWFDYKVTGSDLNTLTTKVQDYLLATNNQQIQVIREFEQIYETFESLDRGYIQGMLASIGAAQKASEHACNAATKASKALEETTSHTKEIDNLVKIQTVTIQKLVKFNNEQVAKNEGFASQIEIAQNEISQNKTLTNERLETQEELISKQNNHLIEISNKQAEQNKSVAFQIEKIRSDARENELRINEQFNAQSAMFLK